MSKPYIEKYTTRGDITVWIVDGDYIRDNIDDQFTNFGQHYRFSFIPELEFWLDEEAAPDEMQFYITHLLVEHRLMSNGESYESAIVKADSVERSERNKIKISRNIKTNKIFPQSSNLHIRLYKELTDGVKVWIVNGRIVRNTMDIDFTEGGHEYVYDYVPKDEVWIDNDLKMHEADYVLLHELYERNLMKDGMSYEQAHAKASKIETFCRHHPKELNDNLRKFGWN